MGKKLKKKFKKRFHPSRALQEIKERYFSKKYEQGEINIGTPNPESAETAATETPLFTEPSDEQWISDESVTTTTEGVIQTAGGDQTLTDIPATLETRSDMEFDNVTVESIGILETFVPSEDAAPVEIEYDLTDINPNVSRRDKKRTQGDIDREIVARFYSNQTPSNFQMIWDRFYYGVHSYACKIMGDWFRSDDAVQETFQKAWEKRAQYNPEKSVYSTWLYAICRNVCFSEFKKQNNDIIDTDVNEVFYSTMYANNASYARTDEVYYMTEPDGTIASNNYDDISHKLYDASLNELSQMDPLFAKIFEMKNIHDMTLKEIAKTLDLKESRVKNVYYKNKEILAERIKTRHDDLCTTFRDAKHDRDEAEIFGR